MLYIYFERWSPNYIAPPEMKTALLWTLMDSRWSLPLTLRVKDSSPAKVVL